MPQNKKKFQYSDFQFAKKKKSHAGKISLVLSGLSLLCLPAALGVSVYQGGQGAALIGGIGYAGMILAIFARLSVRSVYLEDEDADRKLPRRAKRCSIVMLIIWIVIFLMGIVL